MDNIACQIQYPRNYIVWDLETSGLDPKKDQILEIGYQVYKKGELIEEASILLKHDIIIPQKITEITGITQEMMEAEGQDPIETLKVLVAKIDGLPHVTHNGTKFDIPFLLEAAFRSGMSIEQSQDLARMLYRNSIDTAVMFKAAGLKMPRRFNETMKDWADRVMDVRAYGLKYNVKACCEALGIDMTGATQHRALGDVRLTNQIYLKIAHAC